MTHTPPLDGEGDEDPDAPPGTARLRTRLSWRRTALSATGVMLLTLKTALIQQNVAGRALIIAVAALGWLGLLAICRKRIAAMTGTPPAPAGWSPAGMALGIAGFAVLGIAAAVLP
ncbi:DUF202 domain-containing protein [Rugosimonospora africana]|uniref:DUF202 domain-containing protein n=1 Tax=Rugosimonospora africana TaxID=556532 RepID=A0A8J3QQW2_9ACTN|nr:DUF202 domain-containing protein [Rugosimonospora africana]GIH13521.1 hypothetical protein Raf01_16930 [Rugosimonospora africana]